MKIRFIIPVLIFHCIKIVIAQQDTLFSYSIETGEYTDYPLALIITSNDSDHTGWNFGDDLNIAEFSLTSPDTTDTGSGFSPLIPAQQLFSVSDYPVRTAVKIFREEAGELIQECSGILVASNYVLTDCHCISSKSPDDQLRLQFFENVWVYPAYDNGTHNPQYSTSPAVAFMTFKSNIQGPWGKDIALIRLEKPIGGDTGWVGIAFNNDNSYFEENIFHEFSYPCGNEDNDPEGRYNGDTLFYNYGSLNSFSGPWMGYSGQGISGQSGSSLLYANNESYYSYGTFVWQNTWHQRIDAEIFYSFKALINSDTTSITSTQDMISGYELSGAFPNPFNPTTRILYVMPNSDRVLIKLFDLKGREVGTLVDENKSSGSHELLLNMSEYESGVYFYQMQSGIFSESKKIMLLK